jgi:hypothetical protein
LRSAQNRIGEQTDAPKSKRRQVNPDSSTGCSVEMSIGALRPFSEARRFEATGVAVKPGSSEQLSSTFSDPVAFAAGSLNLLLPKSNRDLDVLSAEKTLTALVFANVVEHVAANGSHLSNLRGLDFEVQAPNLA